MAISKIIMGIKVTTKIIRKMKIEITSCIKATKTMNKKSKTFTIKKTRTQLKIMRITKIMSRMKNWKEKKIWREISKK